MISLSKEALATEPPLLSYNNLGLGRLSIGKICLSFGRDEVRGIPCGRFRLHLQRFFEICQILDRGADPRGRGDPFQDADS